MVKVLVLDDDLSVLEVVGEALSYEKFEVKAVSDSLTVLKEINEYHPDIIILDYLNNDINGGEICHQVKCNPATQHIPVIIMSAIRRFLSRSARMVATRS